MSHTHEPVDGPSDQPSPRPRDVPFIHNYCDRWCERCRFQQRCRSYREVTRMELELSQGMPIELAAAGATLDAEIEEEQQAVPSRSPREEAEFQAWLAEINRPPTPEELAETQALMAISRQRRESHPLASEGRDYAVITRGVTTVLRPMIEKAGDPVATAAIETIDRLSSMIAVKVLRALGSAIDAVVFGDVGALGPQCDSNGTAKLVHLMLAESRDAWEVLTRAGRAVGDGVPAAMIRRIDAIDAAVTQEFPEAMSFVRPGFDEEAPAQ